jgi:hypothetical protein
LASWLARSADPRGQSHAPEAMAIPAVPTGVDRMPFPILLAYFGPEVQLPLLSLIGALSGVFLMVGRAPIRVVRRWFGALRGRSKSS